jgi:hypothetical protein
MPASETGSVARMRKVSGSRSQTMQPQTTPAVTSVTKIERQPKPVCNTPPTTGANTGASAITAPISDNSRPARTPE